MVQALLSLAEELREVTLKILNLGLNEVLELLNGINFSVDLLRLNALVYNVGVVRRSSTVPGKKLYMPVSNI